MLQAFILGAAQGITEWLPISSTAIIVSIQNNFFGRLPAQQELELVLFLHIGTLFASLLYFRKEILQLIKTALSFKTHRESHPLFIFLLVSTAVSGILGFGILKLFLYVDTTYVYSTDIANFVLGVSLLITAGLAFSARRTKNTIRTIKELTVFDGIFLGVLQGISAIPGISRSGSTIAGLLLRNIEKTDAVKTSFLMGIPVIFGANIILNLQSFTLSGDHIVGFLSSFAFGIATIHLCIRATERFNFAYFVLGFGLLLIGIAIFPF